MTSEAVCEKCGETFIPNDYEDAITRDGVTLFEHYATENGEECGGYGPIVGSWGIGAALQRRVDECTCPRGSFDPGCVVHGDGETTDEPPTTLRGVVTGTLIADALDPMRDIVNVAIDRADGGRHFTFYASIGAFVSGDVVNVVIEKVTT